MNIIVPMAGMGKRMRPHTLTTPKPLIPVAGKSIVEWLCIDISKICKQTIDTIAFVIGDFGKEAEENLLKIAESVGAKGKIFYQDEALGTAHAVYCAKKCLGGEVIIAFADTLFKANFDLDKTADGTIWVHRVSNPDQFGVVLLNDNGDITDFIEKPQKFITDLAIIGIYYLKDGENLKNEIQYLIDNNIKEKGEFQLTNALENMKKKGKVFRTGKVDEWLDCGNKNATVYTNQRVLENNKNLFSNTQHGGTNNVIVPPCYIAEDVVLNNCNIGPYVSIGKGTSINNSTIENSIIQYNSKISNAKFTNSMIGNNVNFDGTFTSLSIGDFSTLEN